MSSRRRRAFEENGTILPGIAIALTLAGLLLIVTSLNTPTTRILADGTINWTGNGSENLPCSGNEHWVLSPLGDITGATLHLLGVDYTMSGTGNLTADTNVALPDDIVFSTVTVSFTGSNSNDAHLQLSHCEGVAVTPTATATATSTATGTVATETPTATGTVATNTPTATGTVLANTPTATETATTGPGALVVIPTETAVPQATATTAPEQQVSGIQGGQDQQVAGVQRGPEQQVAGVATLPSTGQGTESGGRQTALLILGLLFTAAGLTALTLSTRRNLA